jgi:hypothetical protein
MTSVICSVQQVLCDQAAKTNGPLDTGLRIPRSVRAERPRLAGCSNRLPRCWGWLSNDVPAGRGLAVACRTRGECRKVVMHNRVTITSGNELILPQGAP